MGSWKSHFQPRVKTIQLPDRRDRHHHQTPSHGTATKPESHEKHHSEDKELFEHQDLRTPPPVLKRKKRKREADPHTLQSLLEKIADHLEELHLEGKHAEEAKRLEHAMAASHKNLPGWDPNAPRNGLGPTKATRFEMGMEKAHEEEEEVGVSETDLLAHIVELEGLLHQRDSELEILQTEVAQLQEGLDNLREYNNALPELPPHYGHVEHQAAQKAAAKAEYLAKLAAINLGAHRPVRQAPALFPKRFGHSPNGGRFAQ
ncbi:hypothetical protein P7C70_g3820, partial [Phenoliferia sp. Uapishka_3]